MRDFYRTDLSFNSHRSPVLGRRGMVATSQPLAVAAGLEILGLRGNAADAAVAAAAALNVTEPTSTGIGGDAFALYFDAANSQVSALNASGRSPNGLTLERLSQEGIKEKLPPFHPHTITVPGACAGWCDLVSRHGLLDISTVLTPAINLAESGFPVAPMTAYFWERAVERQLGKAPGGLELTIDGRAPKPGQIFRNPGLARTLKMVADRGKEVFYQGEIAEAIADTIQKSGGCMTTDDLAAHSSTWEKAISTTYRGFRIWQCPPNGQGLIALLALNILEGFDLWDIAPLSVERLHLEIEALRLAFAAGRWYISDPTFSKLPISQLLSKQYAGERRKLINPSSATLTQEFGKPQSSSDTVYLSVVDEDGNACSFINSNYMGFGTGIVPSGWGFSLQNRGHGFSLNTEHPNALAPGKRPYHTIIPSMITKKIKAATSSPGVPEIEIQPSEKRASEELFACFGVMGGFMQPQGHTQVAIALVDDHLNPQAALDRPRFCITDGKPSGRLALEEGIPISIMSKLAQMGHQVTPVSGHGRAIFGRGQIIIRDSNSGVLWAGSDPRTDGCAMSL